MCSTSSAARSRAVCGPGMVAALGVVSGCFVHVFAAALGVGALLATSATAFHLAQVGGCGLPDVDGCQVAAGQGRWFFHRAGGRERGGGGGESVARVPPRFSDQCPEPQGGAVLPGLCAAVHRAGHRGQGDRLSAAGSAVQPELAADQLRLRLAGPAGPRAALVRCSAPCTGWTARPASCSSALASSSPCPTILPADFRRPPCPTPTRSPRRKPCSAPSSTAKSSTTRCCTSCA